MLLRRRTVGHGNVRLCLRLARLLSSESAVHRERRERIRSGPDLSQFIIKQGRTPKIHPEIPPYIDPTELRGDGLSVYLDVHGCQMNVSDAEVVLSVLEAQGYKRSSTPEESDVWLIVTCSIREGTEEKIWKKLRHIKRMKKQGKMERNVCVGVLGCMAERIRTGLFRESGLVDIVAGPDSYKDLPRLLSVNRASGQAAINVMLSQDETYSDLAPVRLSKDSVTAFVSIQRGCDNMCSYCIVPFTRGRERSRPISTILQEVQQLSDMGVKEVTLLGQNVNSYRDLSEESLSMFNPMNDYKTAKGFKTVYKEREGGLKFADLLDKVSLINPDMRVWFTSPHPKDFPEEVLHLIAERKNISKRIHLPAQCGSNRVLESMRRGYTVESYLDLVQNIRKIIPGVALTSDFIIGFCGETEDDFMDTVKLLTQVQYHKCFIFPYSLREKTGAHRRLKDDVSHEEKTRRFNYIRDLYREGLLELHKSYIGTTQKILITGDSKRSTTDFQGTADFGTKVIFPKTPTDVQMEPGDFVDVKITSASSEVLKGEFLNVTNINL